MPTQLTLSTTSRGSAAVVAVGGEIDLGTAGDLGDHLISAMAEVGPDLVLDLSDVSFMDSTGLKVLLATHKRAQLAGGNLVLASVGRSVSRVLSVTGLDQTFVMTDTVEQALDAVQASQTSQAAAD